MAPVLNSNMMFFQLDDEFDEDTNTQKTYSLWSVDGDFVAPSTNVKLLSKLEPGVYNVIEGNSPLCKKINIEKDNLFTFDDPIIENILSEISNFWGKYEEYKSRGYIHKRGVFLDGPGGTGKTSIVNLLTQSLVDSGGVVFKVTGFRNFLTYVSFIKNHFRKIEPNRPVITVIEDIDQYEEVDPELLDFLDGSTSINHHVVIATSNNTEDLPDTYLRTCRFDLKVTVLLPDKKRRRDYFEKLNVPSDMLDTLAEKTKDLSMSDLKELYILIYLLNFPLSEAISRVTNPLQKTNYLVKPQKTSSLGI